ncbi:MAG: ATP-dependent DNA ligase [Akkermansiaceae bacterium]|nr:ATP-dependent DNA ligase [Akkermansiaceae bacterium]
MIPVEFHRGIHLPEVGLWLDPWDAKPLAFVSHAHADHFSRHELAICTATTARLVRARYHFPEDRLLGLADHQPHEIAGHRLRLLPAGHICGSAMIHITRLRDGATLLYTGDFKVRRGRTCEPASFLQADQLILETTFGLPQFVFPPALEVETAVLRFVHNAFNDGDVPILLGYSLGKAQEALALLHEHGIPAALHPKVAEMTQACRLAGVSCLPEPLVLDEALAASLPPGTAVIAAPNTVRSKLLRAIPQRRTAMLSGWALTPGAAYRYRVDDAIPLSDHADHPGLLECIQRVRPKRVLTVHGYAREFAAELRRRGIDAWSAQGHDQLELAVLPQRAAGPEKARHHSISPRHHRPICPFADFTDLCRLVGETQSRTEKTLHLARHLRQAGEHLDLIATWLTGRPLPRPHGSIHTGSATLRRALLALPDAREERYREISLTQNDAARTARLVLEELPLQPAAATLDDILRFLVDLAATDGSLARIDLLAARLRKLHPAEGETLVKLLTGDLRIGLKQGLVEDAIAQAFDADPADLRRAHMLTGDLGETAILARDGRLHEASLRPGVAVMVMLASPTSDIDQLHQQHPAPLWLEPKYDGIRSQLHKSGGHCQLFSRDLKPLDSQFPEILAAAREIPGDFIIDGEIIAHADGRKLTFFDLQKRLGRLNTSQGDLFGDSPAALPPVRFNAFDILLAGSETLLDQPLEARRIHLEKLLAAAPPAFAVIERIRSADPRETEAAFKLARTQGHEGLISKSPHSPYSPGRRGKSWLKLKGVMPTLDCIVVAAEQGHGKRAEVLSDYTFALRDEHGALRIIGKAYSGLTDLEIEELTEHFRKHTLEVQRRKHLVEPNLVLEIAFDSIQPSKRHDSGLALRFPRIHAIRRDKSLQDIDTLAHAWTLVRKA